VADDLSQPRRRAHSALALTDELTLGIDGTDRRYIEHTLNAISRTWNMHVAVSE
jgi:hypothetical protein